MYDTLLFDLDGTLTDSAPGIVAGFQHALRALGLPEGAPAVIRGMIGGPVIENSGRFGVPVESADRFVREFREYYNDRGIYENSPYPGVVELLEALRRSGCCMALATAKPLPAALRVLEHFGIGSYFSTIVESAPQGEVRPKAVAIREVLQRLTPPSDSRIAMVGDRSYDILGAIENGIDGIGVLHGYGTREELVEAGATHLVASAAELQALLFDGRRRLD